MRRLGPLSEADVILEFLRGEAASPRFRPKMAPALEALGADWSLIGDTDVHDPAQARLRRELLWAYRGPGGTAPLLEGFPDDVGWERVALTRNELLDVRYMRYPYWDELSAGTRSPRRAAERIRAGIQPVPGPATSTFVALADVLAIELADAADAADAPVDAPVDAAAAPPPRPILVAERPDGPFVVLEGHSRITAMALRPDEAAGDETEVVIGVSPAMSGWVGL